MKKKVVMALMITCALSLGALSACTNAVGPEQSETQSVEDSGVSKEQKGTEENMNNQKSDQELADEVAALIDAIYVQSRTEQTDAQCAAAKAAWDKLTDAQKELVEGEKLLIVRCRHR